MVGDCGRASVGPVLPVDPANLPSASLQRFRPAPIWEPSLDEPAGVESLRSPTHRRPRRLARGGTGWIGDSLEAICDAEHGFAQALDGCLPRRLFGRRRAPNGYDRCCFQTVQRVGSRASRDAGGRIGPEEGGGRALPGTDARDVLPWLNRSDQGEPLSPAQVRARFLRLSSQLGRRPGDV